MKKLGAKVITAGDINTACDQLLLGRADAVVYDYPVLRDYEKKNPKKVKLVNGIFDKQYYGFVLPVDTEIAEDIDRTILGMYEDGFYQQLYDKWF